MRPKRTLVRVQRERYARTYERARALQSTGRASGSTQAFAGPTPAQEQGWPAIASGEHTLIQAPTGSGKTLAAFLYGIDRLNAAPGEGLRLLYVSPLKALNYDVERNLRGPLAGLAVGAARRRAHRRHAREGARGDAAQAAGHPDHHARVALPAAHLAGAGDAAQRRDADPRRGARRRRHEARRAPGAVASSGSTACRRARPARSGSRRPSARSRRSAGSCPARGRSGSSTRARARSSTSASSSRSRTCASPEPVRRDRPAARHGRRGQRTTSIWPSIYPELLRLVEEHRSTIVFVNNRRLAERLALRLNELAEKEIARAHHGSLAREQRVEIEELLKRGEIPCLVATSSLELGIDMGAVDLVIQVESPKSVARGLQRIGRAGHELGAVSKGRIFPKFRADLLESAVVAERMLAGEIEETVIPRNPLDVLAQQIVAICADEEIEVDELHELVRGAYPFADLSRVAARERARHARRPLSVGRVRRAAAADRLGPHRAARSAGATGARRLAVTNAGTIPDRGLFGVHLVDGGGRVGELDEEMVYEARAGQTFLLGASTWRIEEITRDRVLVSPAPGRARARCRSGRARASGGRTSSASRSAARRASSSRFPTSEGARPAAGRAHARRARRAATCSRSCDEQAGATGAVPSDRTVVVERFRDEIGDWRVCILTPFGARVHAPWAMALAARLRESLGLEVQSIWSDDGIALHLPDADAPPPTEELLIDPDELEELVVDEVGADGALRLALPRERRARAADPAPPPGRAHAALAAAPEGAVAAPGRAPLPAFPIVLETYRECLQDVFDLPGAASGCCTGLRTRQLDLVDVETPSRVAVLGLAALRLHRDVHVRGRHAAGRAARAGALARPRPAARAARPGGAARPARPGRARGGRGAAARRTAQRRTICTTCCGCAATCELASTTTRCARRCCASAARSASGSPARSG